LHCSTVEALTVAIAAIVVPMLRCAVTIVVGVVAMVRCARTMRND